MVNLFQLLRFDRRIVINYWSSSKRLLRLTAISVRDWGAVHNQPPKRKAVLLISMQAAT